MASIKITELTEKTEVGINDVFPIVDATTNETKKITGANLLSNQYSTNEIKTNMKWIDGKDIYRKTIYISEMPSIDPTYPDIVLQKTYQTGLTNVDKLLSMNGTYYSTSQQYPSATFPLNYVLIGSTESSPVISHHISTRISQDSSTITIICSDFFSTNAGREYKGYITLEYTKTTD